MIFPKIGFFVVGSMILAYGALSAQGQTRPKKIRDKVDFNRDIRPILANKCLNCHGNDPSSVRAGLRLDNRAGAIARLPDGNFAVVPGKPAKSMLIDRINAEVPALRMPPVDSHKVLSQEEKDLLRQWVAEGAEYKQHWGFVKPVRPQLPKVKLKTWPKNEIDYFVLAELEKKGLKPSPEADRATLLRRVSLDLTGLPPTPAEVAAFQNDKSPNAYGKVVDRLLASPRYGERMAMDWMDYARYADSNGYQADFERYQWRWRDWVIDAYNKNMPYSKFTVEQLAGDMLPNPTLDQKIATGFNRNHRINTEGGVIAEEWRVETVIDRVETTTTVWLGLTAGCARCHDHKYDPISQKEFYQFFAYFNNVPESGTGEERAVNHPPFIKAPYPEQEKKLTELQAYVNSLKNQVDSIAIANESKADAWKLEAKTPPASLKENLVGRYSFGPAPKAVAGQVPEPKIGGKPKFGSGRSSGSVETTSADFLDLGNVGNFGTAQPFSYAVWVNPVNGNGSPFARMDVGNNYRGWDFFMNGGKPAIHLIDTWPQDALKVVSKTMIPNNQWSHVTITYDGSAKPEGVKIYVNGQLTEYDVEANALKGDIKSNVNLTVGRRTTGDIFNGKIDDLVLYAKVLNPTEVESLSGVNPAKAILDTPKEKRTKEQEDALSRMWSREFDPNFSKLDKELQEKSAELRTLENAIPTLMVMEEMKKPRDAYLLVRGEYDKRGAKVFPGLPKVFPGLPKGVPNNRLGFAEWIVSPENPLTSRVAVNRYWERFFGEGIAPTTEDFGTRAEFPTHPALLDWLATEYVKNGWNTKALMKKIAMSATYRQSSKIPPKLMAIDPTNKLLARGPRFRLPAEVIRDQAMFAAGLLHEQIGGQSVRPYQPDGIWDETSFYGNLHNYKHDMGGNLYRRSLYTIWKRTAAPPNMTLFDASTRETCRVRRARTDTPLQALTLMNDETYLEAARVLAQRMVKEGGTTPAARIDFAFQWVLGRKPSLKESQILQKGLAKRLSFYKKNPDAAKGLVAVGEAPIGKDEDTSELAAYMIAASTLLNLDESVTKE
jgi:hypothetical protein